jgi:hypothetical protein
MDLIRFASRTRALDPRSRHPLHALTGASALGTPSISVGARKNRRRKKKANACPACPACPSPPAPPPLTCSGSCPGNCAFCFERADAPALCGDSLSTTCAIPCASDNDCAASGFPYCVLLRVDLATATVDDPCPAVAGGACISISACV